MRACLWSVFEFCAAVQGLCNVAQGVTQICTWFIYIRYIDLYATKVVLCNLCKLNPIIYIYVYIIPKQKLLINMFNSAQTAQT